MEEDAKVVVYTEAEARFSVVRNVLSGLGLTVVRARSERELAHLAELSPADLVVVEGPLSEHNGVRVLALMREAGVGIPGVVLCTSRIEVAGLALDDLRPCQACTVLEPETLRRAIVTFPLQRMRQNVVPNTGRLSEHSLESLLLHILETNATMELDLSLIDAIKTIHFEEGIPVFCSSNILAENLGQTLIRKGIINEVEYQWARKMQVREGIRQGEALVKIGVLRHQTLFKHLRDHIVEKIVNAFDWSDAEFELKGLDRSRPGITRFAINPIEILLEGTKLHNRRDDVAGSKWAPLARMWSVATCQSNQIASYVHGVIEPAVLKSLGSPRLNAELAQEQSWAPAHAAAVLTTLERVGYISMSVHPQTLPVAAQVPLTELAPDGRQVNGGNDVEAQEPREKLADALWKAYLRNTSSDYFSILGVSPDSPPVEVKAAREELLDLYSNEWFSPVLKRPTLVKALEDVQGSIKVAADTLLNPDRRREYLARLDRDEQDRRKRLIAAEEDFEAGVQCIETDPGLALRHFQSAIERHPGEPQYLFHLAWASYLCAKTAEAREQGLKRMERAMAAVSGSDRAHLALAVAYRAEDKREQALWQAQAALETNPTNTEAQRVVTELEGAALHNTQVGAHA